MRRTVPTACLLLLILLTSLRLDAQSISGIVNRYTSLVAVGECAQITVADTTGFSPGDLILIIQMKGATIDQSESPTFGAIRDTGDAGNFELATIASISGRVFQLQSQLLRHYSPSGAAQIVRVPRFTDVTIDGTVTAPAWNGTTGGVVAIDATGTIRCRANIDVSGLGFRGGDPGVNNGALDVTLFAGPGTTGACALKGEGVGAEDLQHNACHGRSANGGGGGNAHNCGGGGGGNGGVGGKGGIEWSGSRKLDNGGLGGDALATGSTRIFLGGGGGGGHQNNNVGTAGSNGGGIVILRAATIEGNGSSIIANGPTVLNAGNDGAGGGGAGGSVVLAAQSFTSSLHVEAKGGAGGGNTSPLDCHGPGAGGGGGVIWFMSPALPGGVTTAVDGGAPGIVLNSSNQSCRGMSYGATAGSPGVIRFDTRIQEGNQSPVTSGSRTDTTICPDDSLLLTVTRPDATGYRWTPADAVDCPTCRQVRVHPATSMLYTVRVDNASGCSILDSIMVTVKAPAPLDLGGDRTICAGESVQLSASGGKGYHWEPAEGLSCVDCASPVASPTHTITYHVTAPFTATCLANGSVTVHVTELTALFDTTIAICPGGITTIGGEVSGGTPPYSYNWSPSAGLDRTDIPNPVAHPDIDTRYTMSAVDARGCRLERSVMVKMRAAAIELLTHLDAGQLEMGGTDLATLRCDSVVIRNVTNDTIAIDDARLAQNLQFSLPPSQFPLAIPPGASIRLEICHQPRSLGESRDTLYFTADCSMRLPLRAVGTYPGLNGHDRCGNGLTLRPSDSTSVTLKVAVPYPNPISGGMKVLVEVVSIRHEQIGAIDCTLLDAAGNVVTEGSYHGRDEIDPLGFIRRDGTYTIATGDLPSGMYFVAVRTPEETRVYPLVVGR